MTKRKFLLLATAALLTGLAFAEEAPKLQTVSHVDLSRYMGKWYEIARYPAWFEKSCVRDVTATYSLRDDGKVQVVNECVKADGQLNRSTGTAKVADTKTNAKLKVTFFWPFSGDYWVIELDPEYRWAVVGEPDRKYLWILSRTPQLDKRTYDDILSRLPKHGYTAAKLMR